MDCLCGIGYVCTTHRTLSPQETSVTDFTPTHRARAKAYHLFAENEHIQLVSREVAHAGNRGYYRNADGEVDYLHDQDAIDLRRVPVDGLLVLPVTSVDELREGGTYEIRVLGVLDREAIRHQDGSVLMFTGAFKSRVENETIQVLPVADPPFYPTVDTVLMDKNQSVWKRVSTGPDDGWMCVGGDQTWDDHDMRATGPYTVLHDPS